MAYTVTTYRGMAYIVMAYIVATYILMAYIVMAYIVTTYRGMALALLLYLGGARRHPVDADTGAGVFVHVDALRAKAAELEGESDE